MPPIIALFLSFVVTAWLIRRDRVPRPAMDFARWLVMLWLMIRASRPVTLWFGGGIGGDTDLEGNQLEALITLGFFLCAVVVLSRRAFDFSSIPRLNIFFFLLIAYLGLSCAWSPFPFSSFKRWSKEFGAVLIALVLVTDARPIETLKLICVRCAYLLFPLSIVLIKYFPHLGRAYSTSGERMVTGVTDQKNSLGLICCIFTFALLWDLFDARRRLGIGFFSSRARTQLAAIILGCWLLLDSQSKTSLVALCIGLCIFFAYKIRLVSRHPLGFSLACFLLVAGAEIIVGLSTVVAAPVWEALGRDATLSDRTRIWQAALDQPTNPLFGSGFYIFWNEYGPAVWERFEGHFYVRSVHNGYIETYLDSGMVGCTLLGIYLLTMAGKLGAKYSADSSFTRFAFALFIILVITNFSEVYIFRLGSLWFIVVFLTMSVSLFPQFELRENTLRTDQGAHPSA